MAVVRERGSNWGLYIPHPTLFLFPEGDDDGSEDVYQICGRHFTYRQRHEHELKGTPQGLAMMGVTAISD